MLHSAGVARSTVRNGAHHAVGHTPPHGGAGASIGRVRISNCTLNTDGTDDSDTKLWGTVFTHWFAVRRWITQLGMQAKYTLNHQMSPKSPVKPKFCPGIQESRSVLKVTQCSERNTLAPRCTKARQAYLHRTLHTQWQFKELHKRNNLKILKAF